MGLDRGDTVVRRRLIEKMRLLLEDTERIPPPTAAELEGYLRAHASEYARPARVTFTQVFVSAQGAGQRADEIAAGLKTQLDGGADPATLGDPFLRGRDFRLHSEAEIAAIFGPGFAATVVAAPPGVWTGPVHSPYGAHLVRVGERQPGVEPGLAAVRERVARDWRVERRRAIEAESRARRRARYVVRVEGAAP